MKAFDDAGIYLFVDLDDFPTQIEQVSSSLDTIIIIIKFFYAASLLPMTDQRSILDSLFFEYT